MGYIGVSLWSEKDGNQEIREKRNKLFSGEVEEADTNQKCFEYRELLNRN